MKSAYELAMERLQKTQPQQRLTDKQKDEIADIESRYKARIAEREITFQDSINAAMTAGDVEKLETLRSELAREKAKLEAERNSKKEGVRSEAGKKSS